MDVFRLAKFAFKLLREEKSLRGQTSFAHGIVHNRPVLRVFNMKTDVGIIGTAFKLFILPYVGACGQNAI